MASRLGALAPRILVVATVFLLATATITFAAAKRMSTPPQPASAPPTAAPLVTLAVPNVTGQAYVFAKGMLEDAGFAWRVARGSHGYAGYRVVAQSPKAGVRVVDTGAPTVLVRLIPGGRYSAKDHAPDQGSPYAGTAIRFPRDTSSLLPSVPKATKPAAKPHAAKPTTHKAATTKPAAVKKKVAVAPKKRAAAKPATRTPAFTLANAPHEPLDEMPLSKRARLLATWVAAHHEPTASNIHHWIYQHAWIVTGARYGWSNGATALRTLIAVDHTIERQWGMGSRSGAEAQQALRFVEAHSK